MPEETSPAHRSPNGTTASRKSQAQLPQSPRCAFAHKAECMLDEVSKRFLGHGQSGRAEMIAEEIEATFDFADEASVARVERSETRERWRLCGGGPGFRCAQSGLLVARLRPRARPRRAGQRRGLPHLHRGPADRGGRAGRDREPAVWAQCDRAMLR
jgi:hypothetical protein